MYELVKFEGKTVTFRDCGDWQHDSDGRTCPLCGRPFTPPGLVIRMLSSEIGVPNRLIHNECLAAETLKDSLRNIVRDWREAQPYRHWFITGDPACE